MSLDQFFTILSSLFWARSEETVISLGLGFGACTASGDLAHLSRCLRERFELTA
jgi:hypothetical protein